MVQKYKKHKKESLHALVLGISGFIRLFLFV